MKNLKCGVSRFGFILLVILALLAGCQIDYPMSTDFPSESAQVEVDA